MVQGATERRFKGYNSLLISVSNSAI